MLPHEQEEQKEPDIKKIHPYKESEQLKKYKESCNFFLSSTTILLTLLIITISEAHKLRSLSEYYFPKQIEVPHDIILSCI